MKYDDQAGKISSSCAIELMMQGKTAKDLHALLEKADFMQDMAEGFPLDRNAVIANLAKSPDSFREIFVLRDLKKYYAFNERQIAEKQKENPEYTEVNFLADFNAVNTTSSFNALLKGIEAKTMGDINLYLGTAGIARLASFLVRMTEKIAVKFDPDLAPWIRGSVASAVENAAYSEMAAYRDEYMASEDDILETARMLSSGVRSPFIKSLARSLESLVPKYQQTFREVQESFQKSIPAFASRQVEYTEHQMSISDMFDRFRQNGLKASYGIGIKKYGPTEYEKRLKMIRPMCQDAFAKPQDAIKIAAKLAASDCGVGGFKSLSAYLDRDKPLPYDVPKSLETKHALATTAAKIMACDTDAASACGDIVSRVAKDPVWSCIGGGKREEGFCASAFAMIVKDAAAVSRYGEDKELAAFLKRQKAGGDDNDRASDHLW